MFYSVCQPQVVYTYIWIDSTGLYLWTSLEDFHPLDPLRPVPTLPANPGYANAANELSDVQNCRSFYPGAVLAQKFWGGGGGIPFITVSILSVSESEKNTNSM